MAIPDQEGRQFGRLRDVDGRDAVTSFLMALVPGAVAYIELGFATREPAFWMLAVPVIGFAYLLYGQRPHRNKLASIFYYLSIMAFLAPVAMLSSAFIFTGEQAGPFETVGAVVAGGVLVLVTALVGLFVGIAFYLISKRMAVESGSPDKS